MPTKAWLVIVVLAGLLGYGYGNHRLGTKAAAQATAAEAQIKQLGAQVENEMLVRQTKEKLLAETQANQHNSDAKVQALTHLLAQRQKTLPPVPATGPVTPPVVVEPTPTVSTDTLKDELIAAQSKDITDLKAVVLQQSEIIAQDNIIIPQMQKEINLGKIALDAQVAATKSAHVKGIFEGGGTVAVIWGAVQLVTHL